eukprot:828385_1
MPIIDPIQLVILAHPHSVHFMIDVKCYVLLLHQSMAYTKQLFGVCFAYLFMVSWYFRMILHVACVFQLSLVRDLHRSSSYPCTSTFSHSLYYASARLSFLMYIFIQWLLW